MIIKSLITINMNKVDKVSISTIIEDGDIQEANLEIVNDQLDYTVLEYVAPLDETQERAISIYENEVKIRDKAFEIIQGQISMYNDLLSEVARVVKNYDIRKQEEST